MPRTPVAPGSPRVLILDDEPSICAALAQVLRRGGFDPVVAPSTAEADALLGDSIDGLLLDLRIPNMRGDVFFHIAAARYPKLRRRTLFMTGDMTPDAERLVAQTGCGCLWKPFPNARLIEALRALFGETSSVAWVP